MTTNKPGPLHGLRVVEFSHIMAGPTCGLMLADLGAEVVKVERLPKGDDTRRFAPPEIGGESAAFLMMNRNKRGVAFDLSTADGRAAARRLAVAADVVIENQRRGAMEHWGLGYEQLKRENSRLIYCAISGFGRTGPYADRGGFDLIAQGMSGLMSITGEGPGRPPVKVGAPMTDITAGILAAMGILAAVVHRARTNEGQMVDTSLFEAGIVHTYWQSAIALATGVAPGAMGSAHPLSAPYEAFECKDGWITLGAANQANWLRLVDLLGADSLREDPRFRDNAGRLKHRAALAEALSAYFRQRSVREWLDTFDAAGLPAGPILDVLEMQADPQTLARDMVVDAPHSRLGTVKTLGSPVKLSATPTSIRRGAPLLGEHSCDVLREIGYGEDEIERLVASGAVRDGRAS
jgi:crotonobetainyl-CoA:carnitine CoA-transferase CaiB-like acyl-CoA transferase